MEGAIQTKRHRYANENEQNGEDEGIELNLGLSMNGRFGVDPLRKKLKRSSSISSLVFTVGGGENNHARGMAFGSYAPLMRTRSLPTETEEEWMRRKEVESMRRMEARKKRMEKLKNVNNGGVSVQRVLSQGSVRSGSSGSSDLENQQTEGPKQRCSVRFPSNGHSQEQELAGQGKRRNESLKPAMMEMPHVTTKEDGPNGNKVEGFLYRYKMGEEVKIVCVCHGMFLSPAEFVKHGGGGGDVEQPLKHIVVSPFPIS